MKNKVFLLLIPIFFSLGLVSYGLAVNAQEVPPDCTEDTWSCGDWGVCSVDSTQTRTCEKTSDCPTVDTPSPETSQSCTYVAPTCISWTYSDWGVCSAEGQQTRTILSSSPEGCTGGSPTLTQSCTPTPTCTADTWSCGDWNACSTSGSQTRSCSMTYDCSEVTTPSPATTQSCTYDGPTITSISPSVIYGGTTVTVNGSKFMNLGAYAYSCSNCKVLINSQEVSGISSYSWYEDRISFTMPGSAQSGYIQIKDSKGNLSNQFNLTISTDPSTTTPIINSMSPQAITPGNTITITGSNFGSSRGSSQLMIGGTTAYGTIVSWTDTQIQYQTSTYWDDTSQKIGIKKCKSYYECQSIVYGGYFYIQPRITSLDYTSGPVGTTVTISGSYLKNSNVSSDASSTYVAKVYFNGVAATYPVNGTWTSSTLEANVPNGATSGYVTLEISANTGEKVTATGPYFTVWENISNDEYSSLQLYLKQINLPQAWGVASNRRSITVAVIDDGVYNNHPDLQNKMWQNTDEIIGNGIDDDGNGYVDDRYGWDFVNITSDVTPLGSHGTQVAGIIGAEKDNGIGIAGVNPTVKIMPLIVCASNGCIDYSKAIRYAVDNGAEVINLSLGTTAVSGYTTSVNAAIDYAYDHGVLIVTAAGNGDTVGGIGFDLGQIPQSPVCNSDQTGNKVIGVGAVTSENYRTQWSNYGSCVDIWAPGVDVISTAVPVYSTLGGFYDVADGTSFSAPIITGIVSLLKATYPTMTSQEAISLLVNNSNGGVVDAYKTLSANFTPSNTQTVQTPTNNSTNQSAGTYTSDTIANPKNLTELLSQLQLTRNVDEENKYRPLIKSDAISFSIILTTAQEDAITNFVVYGISTKTIILGAGERRALIRDYFETVGRGEVNWDDIERLVNGQKVVARNLSKEQAQVTIVLKVFKKIFGHNPVFSNTKEDLSWNTMMYRIRFPRDLTKESTGIAKFKKIFWYTPKTPLDWAAVRALGYIVYQ